MPSGQGNQGENGMDASVDLGVSVNVGVSAGRRMSVDNDKRVSMGGDGSDRVERCKRECGMGVRRTPREGRRNASVPHECDGRLNK